MVALPESGGSQDRLRDDSPDNQLKNAISYPDLAGNMREASLFQKIRGYHGNSVTEQKEKGELNPLLMSKGILLRQKNDETKKLIQEMQNKLQ